VSGKVMTGAGAISAENRGNAKIAYLAAAAWHQLAAWRIAS